MLVQALVIAAVGVGSGLDAIQKETIATLARTLTKGQVVAGMTVGVIDAAGEKHVWGFGVTELEDGATPDGTTVYEIGSVSKVFTGIMLADADERGLVSIKTPIRELLPDNVVVPSAGESDITLFHLATHTSGLPRLPSNLNAANRVDPYASYSRADLHAGLAGAQLHAGPGLVMMYSNLGVGLLGDLLAMKASQSYEDLLHTRITRPLGMTDTFVMLDREHRDRMARGHNSELDPVTNWEFDALVGAGGIRSTVDDLLILAEAALSVLDATKESGSLPSKDAPVMIALKRSLDRQWPEEPRPARAGLCWHFGADGSARWHNGETGGFHSFIAVDPSNRCAAVILSNTASHMIDELGVGVMTVLAGGTPEPISVRMPAAIDDLRPERYEGEYVSNVGAVMKVASRDGRLYVQLQQQQAFRVYPAAVDRFFVRVVDADIQFHIDSGAAHAHSMTLFQNGRETEFERVKPDYEENIEPAADH